MFRTEWGLHFQNGGCFVLDELARLEHLPRTSSGRKFGEVWRGSGGNICDMVSGTHRGWRLQYLQSSTFLPQAEWREEVKKHFEKIKSEGACIHRLDEELIRRRREELRSAPPPLPTESHFSLPVLLGSLNPPASHRVPLQSRCLLGSLKRLASMRQEHMVLPIGWEGARRAGLGKLANGCCCK